MKNCRKCKIPLKLKKWHKKNSTYICYPCKREYERLYRIKRALDGNPIKCARISLEDQRKYESTPKRKKLAAVRIKLNYAVKIGKVTKSPCVICGDEKSQGHHEDYSKPLEVIWLCRKHHIERHKEIDAFLGRKTGRK